MIKSTNDFPPPLPPPVVTVTVGAAKSIAGLMSGCTTIDVGAGGGAPGVLSADDAACPAAARAAPQTNLLHQRDERADQ